MVGHRRDDGLQLIRQDDAIACGIDDANRLVRQCVAVTLTALRPIT